MIEFLPIDSRTNPPERSSWRTAGDLLLYNNNRDPSQLRRLMRRQLAEFEASGAGVVRTSPLYAAEPDPRFNVTPPDGGLVLRVRARVLAGYPSTRDPWRRIFQTAISRDNLWVSGSEHTRGAPPGRFPLAVALTLADGSDVADRIPPQGSRGYLAGYLP